MKRNRLLIALIAMFSILGITASPALAGNGTSNFYLSGHCYVDITGPASADLNLTDYDNGSAQTYHTAVTRSGVAVILEGIYLDGVYKGKSFEMFIAASGHGRHTVKLVVSLSGFTPKYSCSITV